MMFPLLKNAHQIYTEPLFPKNNGITGSLITNKFIKMSTQSQAQQTLFRFVSLRAPQQSHEKGQNKRFVLAPDSLQDSHFYQYVLQMSGVPKHQALLQYAEDFESNPSNLLDRQQIKTMFPELYDFAVWIARTKGQYAEAELVQRADDMKITFDPALQEEYILKLWNNLIYQVAKQKDFYIKETVMQVLLAIHILQHMPDAESKVLMHARIVLPKDLILDNDATGSATPMTLHPNARIGFPDEDFKKQQIFSAAHQHLRSLSSLKKDISLMQKMYQKAYLEEYRAQQTAHQELIRPILEQYQQEVRDSRHEFCNREDKPPYIAEDPCNKPAPVPLPILPEFEFSFRDEIELNTLMSSLRQENFEYLLYILGYKIPIDFNTEDAHEEVPEEIQSLLQSITAFQDVEDIISQQIDKAHTDIAENVVTPTQIYKSIGGVILPVSKTNLTTPMFYICPKNIARRTSFDLQLTLPDASWDVAGISYILTDTLNNVSFPAGDYYVKSKTGNIIYLNDLMGSATSNGQMLIDASYSLAVQVTFINGQTAQFTANFENLKICDRGSFEISGDETGNPETPKDFVPSGFGFRQIGIADYLKVEQSTHAYVPGDVAHIENIMAREYRQKSTRRLRRSENITTISNDSEKETLTDTTTATRFEMQSEIAKMMAEARETSAFVNFGASWAAASATFNLNTGANFAHHQSKEESTRQAMIQAQEVTERALDRIVSKVHEERIEKIIEEFEENNAHGFDNRKGSEHVSGVFRWVDKLMKNQIYNYGKRMMFEFMVPEPAKLHQLGIVTQEKASDVTLIKPDDPRTSSFKAMKDYASLNDETVLRYWSSKYNVELEGRLTEEFSIGKSLGGQYTNNLVEVENAAFHGEIEIPEGYLAYRGSVGFTAASDGDGASVSVLLGDQGFYFLGQWGQLGQKPKQNFTKQYSGKIPISTTFYNEFSGTVNFSVDVKLSTEAKNAWLQKAFNAIINAYELAMTEYNEQLAAEQNKAVEISGSNPAFYRQIENTVLRKNCISYMVDRTVNSTRGYGLSGLIQGSTFTDYETVLSPVLDQYTAFVKFMEQAFEWENLSYYLYPYYWGSKANWMNLYQQEDVDPLFRSFLQSGMARVIVTVRPGFEDAVQFFMATGKIWNGGQVPVIGDELYLSIADEMKAPRGVKQGKAWISRLPTPLTILQAQTIGLEVEHALPFTDEDPSEFEIPSDVVTQSSFSTEASQLEGFPALDNVNRIFISDEKLVLAHNQEELASIAISELVDAEKQINSISVSEEKLRLMYNDEEITSIPLEEIKAAMGV